MSASAIEAEPVELPCGADGFDSYSSDQDERGNDRYDHFGGGRDSGDDCGDFFRGKRKDYSVRDHGFGIFAVCKSGRDGRDGPATFVSDLDDIEFEDGRFRVADLMCDDSDTEPADETFVEAANIADEIVPWDDAETETEVLTLDDLDDATFESGESVELLTEDVWFSEPEVETTVTAAPVEEVCGVEMDAPENEGPVALDDAEKTSFNAIVESNVADNDFDADGDLLTFALIEDASNGTVTFGEDGSYSYTPDDGFNGVDTFDYQVDDGNGGTDSATVTIEVEPELIVDPPPIVVDMGDCGVANANEGPVAVDDSTSTSEGVAVSGSVAGNDSDPEGDSLTFWVEEGPTNGSLEFNEDGSYTYTPDPGFSGNDCLSYEVADGQGGTDYGEVHIEVCAVVNEGPVAQDDVNITKGGVPVSGSVAGNDSDPEGDTLAFYMSEGPENGSIEFAEDGSYTYTPDPGFEGVDTFTYEAADGEGGSAIATVTITVEPAPNQAPDAVKDVNSTDFESAVTGTVLCNDVDLDSDSLTATLATGPQNGTVTMGSCGVYTYTPNEGFSGQDTFTYEVSDGKGGTDTAEVCIEVGEAPNNDVDAVDDEYSTEEDTAVDGNVLVNDVDPDGDTLTVAPMTDVLTSEGGIVTLHEDGSFVYMPAGGFTGVDTFCYSANDGNGSTATATVTITVNDVPAVPVDDAYEGDNAECVEGNVIINDGGDVSDTTVLLVDAPENGSLTLNPDGTFCYLADDGYSGDDAFSYSIVQRGVVAGVATVRLVLADVEYDTTYVSAGNAGKIWGDPHFEGDDGGLYDVQGEAGHVYSLLSDNGVQVNALFVPWEGHPGSTMMGQIGATVGPDLILADETGTFVNGVAVEAGEAVAIEGGQVEYDGEFTTITTSEYKLELHKREGWYNMKLNALDPFSDTVAPHGLWGLTVDGDSEARHGDYFKTHGWDYTLQGGGALDTVDETGNVVLSETGDRSAYSLYEAANLFSTEALNDDGESFFRFNARRGTGLTAV